MSGVKQSKKRQWQTQKSPAGGKGWFFSCLLFYHKGPEREREHWGECVSQSWLLGTVNNIFVVTCFCSLFSLVSSNRAMISKSLQSLHLSSASQSVLVLTGIMQLKSRGSILEMKECRIAECIPCQFSTVSCYVFNCQLWHHCCWRLVMALELGWTANSVIFVDLPDARTERKCDIWIPRKHGN